MKKYTNSEKKKEFIHKSDAKALFAGGGGGQQYPKVVQDNLISGDFCEIILGLCEGPIEGLADGEKSFYISDLPLQSSSGASNFGDYELTVYNGDSSQDETITPKLGVESPVSIASSMEFVGYKEGALPGDNKYDINTSRRTLSLNINSSEYGDFDYVDFRLQVNQLLYVDNKVQTNGTFVFEFRWREVGSDEWVTFPNQTITGKTTTGFSKDYRLWMPVTGVAHTIELQWFTSLDAPWSYANQWSVNISGVQVGKASKSYKFDNTACVKFLALASSNMPTQPELSGVYNLAIIKVPSNYDGHTHTYTGDWDGTFKLDWTNNPAWILYDILTNRRYGMCSYYEFDVDKYDFYDAGQFCDVMVPDGRGNMVPRYTWNGVIDQQKMGREICSEIAASFNGNLYEDCSGEVRLKVPRDDDPAVHIFSPSNVEEGIFNYSFTDQSQWYNSVSVTFMNEEQNWIQDQRTISDESAIEKYGKNEASSNLIGCTSEQEAIRKAWYALLSYTTEKLTVSFTTTREGLNCEIGDVILVADPDMGYGQSGRVKSVAQDRLSIETRDDMFIEASIVGGGSLYFCDFQVGAQILSYQIVPDSVGYTKTLKFSEPLDANIDKYTVYTLRTVGELTDAGNAKPYRIVSLKESEGGNKITVAALEVNRTKQLSADSRAKIADADYSKLNSATLIPHILGINFDEYFSAEDKCGYLDLNPILDESYKNYSGKYDIYWRYTGTDDPTSWNPIDHLYISTIKEPPIGDLEWTMLPYNTVGQTPSLDTAPAFRYATYDINQPPANVENIRKTEDLESVLVRWDPVEDPDLICYEVRIGDTWEDGEVLSYATTDPQYKYYFPDLEERIIWVKAKDILGTYSEVPAGIKVSAARPKNVSKFYVTTNNDRPRFDWEATGEDVYYEVRTAESNWESGTKICSTTSNGYTSLYPLVGEYRGFYLKTRSKLGAYSEEAVYTEFIMGLMKNRNVIREIDNTLPQRAYGFIEFTSLQEEGGIMKRLPRNPVSGETVTINETTLTFGTDVTIGSTLEETMRNLCVKINNTNELVTASNDKMTRVTLTAIQAGKQGNEISFSTTCVGAICSSSNLTEGLDSWSGVTEGFSKYEFSSRDTIIVNDGEVYAEHYFPVHLPEVTRARNWFETEFANLGATLYMADLDFPWNNPNPYNMNWLNASGVDNKEEGSATPVICWKDASRYSSAETQIGFAFDDVLTDVKETVNPSSMKDVAFGPARCSDGIIINRIVDIKYHLPQPLRTFTLRFTLKLKEYAADKLRVMTLHDDTIDDEGHYTVWSNLRIENNVLIWEDVNGGRLELPFERNLPTDFLYVQIVQRETERLIYLTTERGGTEESVSAELSPLTTFTYMVVGDNAT